MENSGRGLQLQLEEFSVVGDIAGQADALKRLAPKLRGQIILAGDLIDRGPKSKEVIEWAMNNPNVIALMGNHEHLFLDWYDQTEIYQPGIWFGNGGIQTLASYSPLYPGKPSNLEAIREAIPKEHIEWLRTRPLYVKVNGAPQGMGWEEGCLISHAPLHQLFDSLEQAVDISLEEEHHGLQNGLMWCRREPRRREFFQLFGHNANWGVRPFTEGLTTWAYCLDSTWSDKMTAMILPKGEIVDEPYTVDQPEMYRGRQI